MNLCKDQKPINSEDIKKLLLERYPDLDLSLSIYDQFDSILVVDLIAFLEEKFKVNFYPIEYDSNYFQSTEEIAKIVQRKILSSQK